MKRNDVHSPKNIIPADYDYVGQTCMKIEGLGDAIILKIERERIEAHMKATGGTYSRHQHGGNCGVCGSVNAVYTILFHHRPSNTYVRMGQDCARKCEMSGYEGEFNAFRAAVKDARRAVAGKKKAQVIFADEGIEEAWSIIEAYRADTDGAYHYEEATIADIANKVVHYGSISEKQVAFVKSLIDRIERRAEIEAERAAEHEAAAPCPTGRVVVEGVILSTKWQENGYGGALKMVVKDDRGFKVWGTVPNSLFVDARGDVTVAKGCRVRFTATLTPSDDDNKFGFAKRPSKAVLLFLALPETYLARIEERLEWERKLEAARTTIVDAFEAEEINASEGLVDAAARNFVNGFDLASIVTMARADAASYARIAEARARASA